MGMAHSHRSQPQMTLKSSLDKISLFDTLNPDTKLTIVNRAILKNNSAGQTLLLEGVPAEYCYFLVAGDVRVVRMSQQGRIQVLARLSQGAPINIISLLLPGRVNHASAETLTSVTTLAVSVALFDDLLANYPDFSRMLLHTFARRMANITDLAAGLSLYSVRARLAQFLIDLAADDHSQAGWTQDEIAAQIGTVRDVVGRLLRDFEASGLIQRERQNIILLDRQRLYDEAKQQAP